MGNTKLPRYEHYVSKIMCSNCRYRGVARIPVGMKIEQTPCPKCGLMEIHHPGYFGIKE